MTQPTPLDPLDLVALLVRRVCHDLASPIGAVNNGLEVLAEEDDPEMRKIAMDLVNKTATQASARLRYARLAIADSGAAATTIDLGEAEAVARGITDSPKVTLEWSAPRVLLPKNKVKLVLNLYSLAQATIPRGGRIMFEMTGDAETPSFTFTSKGSHARIPAGAIDHIRGESPGSASDSHAIQYYYAGVLARAAGLAIDVTIEGDEVTIAVRPV